MDFLGAFHVYAVNIAVKLSSFKEVNQANIRREVQRDRANVREVRGINGSMQMTPALAL